MTRCKIGFVAAAACLFAALVAVSMPATGAPQPDPTVDKSGDTYRLKVGDKTVAQSKAEIKDAKVVPAPAGAEPAVTWTARTAADGPAVTFYALRRPDGEWGPPKSTTYKIQLHNRKFDPAAKGADAPDADVPAALRPTAANRLYYVQFRSQVLEPHRKAVTDVGGEVRGFVPDLTHVVRMTRENAGRVQDLPFVRAVVAVPPIDKLEQSIVAAIKGAEDGPKEGVKSRYVLLPTGKQDRETMVADLAALGATVAKIADKQPRVAGSSVTVELTAEQLGKAAALNSVQWIERAKKPEVDMDKARAVGGADFLAALPAGYTGVGVRGHVLEGIYKNHPDFAAKMTRGIPIDIDDGNPDDHGQNTYGQVFGDGKTKAAARGLLPDAQGYYTNANAVSDIAGARNALVKKLIDEHKVLFQTASWGNGRTTLYTAYSAELDTLAFDLDIPITQSQSNAGTRDSRPQAWAKNVISVGGAYHLDNTADADDRWSGGASIGPATDGRVKPDLCSFYDAILTTHGASGHRADFNGTSGATPIVAGHVGLCIEMWTNGVFPDCHLPKPATPDNRFDNRPHASTVKALLIASAKQFEFPPATDLDRFRQGWGRPDLKTLHDLKDKSLIVNETDVLPNLGSKAYEVKVVKGEPSLRVTMVYPDPAGNPISGGPNRVNNLDLKVTDPDGVVFWGNYGLLAQATSKSGGSPNTIDTVENVFLANPKAGTWKVEVIADELIQDGHIETAALDADFALVVLGHTR